VSFRARLFLLLLVLSVLPVLLLRLNAQRTGQALTDDLVGRTQHTLVEKAKASMLLMVEDHAELWSREAQLLEQTLRLQAQGVERALARGEPQALEGVYLQVQGGRETAIHGQVTVYGDGAAVLSEKAPRPQRRFDWREALWYRLARERDAVTWVAPVIDPVTRLVGLTVAMPVRDASGAFAGVTALTAPLSVGATARGHGRAVSGQLRSYMVNTAHPESESRGLRIVGEADAPAEAAEAQGAGHAAGHGAGRRMGMLGLAAPRWLSMDDPAEQAAVLADLRAGRGGVRQAELDERDMLWAYAPLRTEGYALVMTAPKRDVAADARRSGEYIEARIQAQFRETFLAALALLAAATLAAWLLARSVARPLVDLARAAARLGQGDFEARVAPAGGGEIEALGHAFNRMIPELKERTRLREAMALAREVHDSLIPSALPDLPGLDLAGSSTACHETGGDFYDVLTDVHGRPGRAAAYLGDVSGHGVDAALLMATARAFLRLRAGQPGDPAGVARDVNDLLCLDTDGTGRFLTLFYLELDVPGRALRWVRAGHDPAILYARAADAFEELGGPGIPLGVVAGRSWPQGERPWLGEGDLLLVGSDGIWETISPAGEMFGKQRVREIMRARRDEGAQAVRDALLAALEAFRGQAPAEDDVTLLVIKAVKEVRE